MKQDRKFILRENAFQMACEALRDTIPNLNEILWEAEIATSIISGMNRVELAKKWKVNYYMLMRKLVHAPAILLLQLLIKADSVNGRKAEDYHGIGYKDPLSKFQELVQENQAHILILSQR